MEQIALDFSAALATKLFDFRSKKLDLGHGTCRLAQQSIELGEPFGSFEIEGMSGCGLIVQTVGPERDSALHKGGHQQFFRVNRGFGGRLVGAACILEVSGDLDAG